MKTRDTISGLKISDYLGPIYRQFFLNFTSQFINNSIYKNDGVEDLKSEHISEFFL